MVKLSLAAFMILGSTTVSDALTSQYIIPSKLIIENVEYFTDVCRGGSGDDKKTQDACDFVDVGSDYLKKHYNLCYKGPTEDSPTYKYKWRDC